MKLSEIVTLNSMPIFTYDNLLRRARTVDVVWFNERQMPCGFYEIEHTTDIKNSLSKFYELQDFRADFVIIADEKRREQFNDIMSFSMYEPIRRFVKFVSYDNLERQYAKEKIVLTELLCKRLITTRPLLPGSPPTAYLQWKAASGLGCYRFSIHNT